MKEKGHTIMTAAEIKELLDLRGWSRTRLAAELELTQNAIDKWFMAGRAPGGPASILLRLWLTDARADRRPPRKAV